MLVKVKVFIWFLGEQIVFLKCIQMLLKIYSSDFTIEEI